ncbi:MAG: thioredoxin family protein [Erythrobacter sp.]|nr:thioredoxin family protein [Erythrobacter sp.]
MAPLVLLLAGCATPSGQAGYHPEQRSYLVTADPAAEVDAALVRAGERGTRVLLVLGANWCHDSRALAGWLATDRFRALVAERYELVYVNVGMPQSGDGHNLAIAERFGLTDLASTPALLVLTPAGTVVNPASARSWRNAASRSESAIYDELLDLATRPA